MKAEIIYKKNLVIPNVYENHPHPQKYAEDNHVLYKKINMGDKPTQVTIDREWFEDQWVHKRRSKLQSARRTRKNLEKIQ